MVVIAWFISWGFCKTFIVEGQSMQPTLQPEDTVMVDRVLYRFQEPERYDLICYYMEAFEAAETDDYDEDDILPKYTVKRIIGLPGETVQITDGAILIDGKELPKMKNVEVVGLAGIASEPVKLEDKEYFVLGDNRKASEDSRYENIGNIEKNRVIGKVWYRTKPVNTAGRLE